MWPSYLDFSEPFQHFIICLAIERLNAKSSGVALNLNGGGAVKSCAKTSTGDDWDGMQ